MENLLPSSKTFEEIHQKSAPHQQWQPERSFIPRDAATPAHLSGLIEPLLGPEGKEEDAKDDGRLELALPQPLPVMEAGSGLDRAAQVKVNSVLGSGMRGDAPKPRMSKVRGRSGPEQSQGYKFIGMDKDPPLVTFVNDVAPSIIQHANEMNNLDVFIKSDKIGPSAHMSHRLLEPGRRFVRSIYGGGMAKGQEEAKEAPRGVMVLCSTRGRVNVAAVSDSDTSSISLVENSQIIVDFDASMPLGLELEEDYTTGLVQVHSVYADSQAEEFGVEEHAVVVAVGETRISNLGEFEDHIRELRKQFGSKEVRVIFLNKIASHNMRVRMRAELKRKDKIKRRGSSFDAAFEHLEDDSDDDDDEEDDDSGGGDPAKREKRERKRAAKEKAVEGHHPSRMAAQMEALDERRGSYDSDTDPYNPDNNSDSDFPSDGTHMGGEKRSTMYKTGDGSASVEGGHSRASGGSSRSKASGKKPNLSRPGTLSSGQRSRDLLSEASDEGAEGKDGEDSLGGGSSGEGKDEGGTFITGPGVGEMAKRDEDDEEYEDDDEDEDEDGLMADRAEAKGTGKLGINQYMSSTQAAMAMQSAGANPVPPLPYGLNKSLRDDHEITLFFVNHSAHLIMEIYWVDYKGSAELRKMLYPGDGHLEQSWASHPWILHAQVRHTPDASLSLSCSLFLSIPPPSPLHVALHIHARTHGRTHGRTDGRFVCSVLQCDRSHSRK